MPILQCRDQRFQVLPIGLRDQQDLGVAVNLSLPSVYRPHPIDQIDTGGKLLTHQIFGERLCYLGVWSSAEHNQTIGIYRFSSSIVRPGPKVRRRPQS